MKTTALRPWHEKAGARFAPFAGFDMPIQYPAGAVEEHRLCRRSVGLFDIDHMGQFLVSGPGAGEALSALVSSAILDMKKGEARYGLILNEAGGVIDDLFLYRLDDHASGASHSSSLSSDDNDECWFVVVNAGNRETDFAWFKERLPPALSLTDISEETYMIAVQGPRAVELLDRLAGAAPQSGAPQSGGPQSGLPQSGASGGRDFAAAFAAAPRLFPPGGGNAALSAIPRSRMAALTLAGIPVLAGRTGYTGEDGAELYYDAAEAPALWEAILAEAKAAGIEAGPVGLAARDSLRFEAGMPLHGHEISPAITPLEALLSWACDFSKNFPGKEALLAQKAAGLKRKLVTLNVSGGVPREGYRVLAAASAKGRGESNASGVSGEWNEIGAVVAGMFCPATGTYSANAFVPPEYAAPGARLAVEIRGTPKEAEVVKRPLYTPVYRRKT